jgi:hypothetical protein
VKLEEGRHYAVEPDGCWRWLKTTNGLGYGYAFVGRPARRTPSGGRPHGYRLAHRVSWEAVHGPIPADLQIDHLCRNRACVNPDHLEAVSSGENTRRGALSKLTWNAVREIRSSSAGTRELGRRFGVDHSVISRVRTRNAWWPEP